MRNLARLTLIAASLFMATGCRSDSRTAQVEVAELKLMVNRAEGVLADGEDAVTITAVVLDDAGRGVRGIDVRFEVGGAGNTLDAPSSTNDKGVSVVTLRSTVAEVKQVRAFVDEHLLAATAEVRFEPGPGERLSFVVPPGSTEAGQPFEPAVRVRIEDAQGNPVNESSARVALSLAGGPEGAALEGQVEADAELGTATFEGLRIPLAGEGYVLRASADGVAEALSPAFAITAGAPARLGFRVEPQDGKAGETFSVQVELQDAQGNPLSDASAEVSVALAENPTGASLGGTLTVAAQGGVATFGDLQLHASGAGYTLAATAPGFQGATSAPFSRTAVAVHAGQSMLTVAPETLEADGVALATVTLVARDLYGNPVPEAAVQLSATGSEHQFSATTGTTDAAGTFTATVRSTRAEVKSVTADVGGVQLAAQVTFVAGAPSSSASALTATPAQLVANGVDQTTLEVQVRDAHGNPVALAPVTLGVSGTGNDLSASSGTTDGAGRFTAGLRSTVAEAKTITATFAGGSVNTQVTFTAGTPVAANSSLVAAPSSAAADGSAPISLTVTLRDAHQNPVSGWPLSLTATGTANTFTTATGTTNGSGMFASALTSTHAEAKTVTAVFSGGTLSAQVAFVAGAPVASNSTFTASPGTATADGTSAVTLTLTLRDAANNLVSGETVIVTATGTQNTLTPASGTTNGSGVFASSMTSTRAEAKTVTATFGGGSLTTQVTFTAGAAVASNSTLTASPTSATADGVSTIGLTLTLRDAHNNAVGGQTVSLSSSGSANTLAPASGTTNGSGEFTSTFTSTQAEAKTVTASFGGGFLTTSVSFTAGAPVASNSSFVASPTSANTNQAIALTVVLRDANNNPVSGQSVSLSSTGSGNTFTPASGQTDGNGAFASSFTSSVGEPKTVTAAYSGGTLTLAVTFIHCTGSQIFNLTASAQSFTVPSCVNTLTIEVWGAQGGAKSPGVGGNGAYLRSEFTGLASEALTIQVGEKGFDGTCGTCGGGGGGGSFVIRASLETPLLIAGGGGGASYQGHGGQPGNHTTSGGPGGYHAVAIGYGGYTDNGGGGGTGAGGGGWLSNGTSNNWATGGQMKGGAGGTTSYSGRGGYGGGGASYHGGGGGGGYTGGSGGTYTVGGGGGGSFNGGTAVSAVSGTNTGNGRVLISW